MAPDCRSAPARDPRGNPCVRAATAGACHAQMYTMGTLLRHGSEEQKQKYLPKIAPANCACRPSA